MVDNSTAAAGPTVATDDIGGIHYQRVKNTWGADGVATDVSAAAPMPTVQTGALPTGANTIGAVTISGTNDVADRAARLLGVVSAGANQIGTIGELRASTLAVTATGTSGASVTLTLPAPGAGLFHYITHIDIGLYSAAARTGAAAPWVVTSTNLPGTLAWTFSTAGAIGTNEVQDLTPATPLKSSAANTATTVVGPVATGGIWRITATYFTAV